MKKYLICFALMWLMISCNRYIAPVFTDVDRISQLKPGMKLRQVVDLLGIEPYDIYHMQGDGSMLLSFNYRTKLRRMKIPTLNQDEFNRQTTNDESQTAGEIFYDKDYKVLYVIIRDGELSSYTTTNGLQRSEIILIQENNLEVIHKKDISTYDEIPD